MYQYLEMREDNWQSQFQCHIQEITTSLAVDSSGTYLVSGTKRGWLYCWELSTGELINSLQAHFKSVTRVAVTKCGNYCYVVSVFENGKGWCERWSTTVRICQCIIQAGAEEAVFLATGNDTLIAVTWTLQQLWRCTLLYIIITTNRSWSPHTLPIKDCHACWSPLTASE